MIERHELRFYAISGNKTYFHSWFSLYLYLREFKLQHPGTICLQKDPERNYFQSPDFESLPDQVILQISDINALTLDEIYEKLPTQKQQFDASEISVALQRVRFTNIDFFAVFLNLPTKL